MVHIDLLQTFNDRRDAIANLVLICLKLVRIHLHDEAIQLGVPRVGLAVDLVDNFENTPFDKVLSHIAKRLRPR